MRLRVRGEARSTSVRSAIESCGGTWVEDKDEEERVDFVIVRSGTPSPHYLYSFACAQTGPVVANYLWTGQIPHSDRAIAPSAGSKVASHASGYAP